jgi:hypothetical protein
VKNHRSTWASPAVACRPFGVSFLVQNQRSTGINPAVAVISSLLLTDRLMRLQVITPD